MGHDYPVHLERVVFYGAGVAKAEGCCGVNRWFLLEASPTVRELQRGGPEGTKEGVSYFLDSKDEEGVMRVTGG